MPKISASTIARMGPPPRLTHGPDQAMISEPFQFEGKEYFRFYIPTERFWFVGETLDPEQRSPVAVPAEEATADGSGIIETMNDLLFFPPPDRVPSEGEPPVFGPFWFRDREFSWVYAGAESNWVLALTVETPEGVEINPEMVLTAIA